MYHLRDYQPVYNNEQFCKYVTKHLGKYLDCGFRVKNLSIPPAPNQIERQYFRKRFSLFKERHEI